MLSWAHTSAIIYLFILFLLLFICLFNNIFRNGVKFSCTVTAHGAVGL